MSAACEAAPGLFGGFQKFLFFCLLNFKKAFFFSFFHFFHFFASAFSEVLPVWCVLWRYLISSGLNLKQNKLKNPDLTNIAWVNSSSGVFIWVVFLGGLHENNPNYARMKVVMMLTFSNKVKKALNCGGVAQLRAARTSSELISVKFLSRLSSTQTPCFTTTGFWTSYNKLFHFWSMCCANHYAVYSLKGQILIRGHWWEL